MKIPITVILFIAVLAMAQSRVGPKKIIIAHRGASGYLPEHTLEAKAMAYAMGADYLEQDLVLSKDGVPVVLHDIHVETISDVAERFPQRHRDDGRYYAIDFTLAELQQLRLTERFNPVTGKPVFPGRFPIWQAHFQIATLEQELQFIQGLNKSTGRTVGIYPEIKGPAFHRREGQDISRIVLDILARYGYKSKQDPIYLQCFDYMETKRIREQLGYQGKLIQLISEKDGSEPGAKYSYLCSPAGLAELALVADGIGPAIRLVVAAKGENEVVITDLVKNAHAAGLQVHPYTLRADELPPYAPSAEILLSLLFVDADVDGLFTDFPDLGVNFLRELEK